MASWRTYVEAITYIALLFFIVPIKFKGQDNIEEQFQEYLSKYNKTYDDPEIYSKKLEAFKKSLEAIELLNFNQSNHTAKYGLTKFSDMLPEEFLQKHLHVNLSRRIGKFYSRKLSKRSIRNLPEKMDWRAKNSVTKVHSQGSCGACWAFSTVETIESMNAIQKGQLEQFSVDQIIECAGYYNEGCNGGDVCNLLLWLNDTKFSLQSAANYQSKSKICNNLKSGVQIEDFICDNLVNSEDLILHLLAKNGPLAVAVNAQTWQNYIGGIIKFHCDGDAAKLNHAVQIVGYDLTTNIPHYIVRNSWGEDFGDGGYLYIAFGENICGVANEVSALRVL